TSVSVVTTDGPSGRFGLTVSAVTSVSADPPLLLICVNRKSLAAAAILGNGHFAVNVLAVENRAFAETFSGRPSSGRPFDFANHHWQLGLAGAPVVGDAAAVFECDVLETHDAGTHRIFIGRVVAARRGKLEPLVYASRSYRRSVTLDH
ncbi:MAG: flavin reductase family protein, partial [Pseudomonadota bacterium]|nr:flavin reductase family protein [Pseudomonadota bacterium]